MKKVKNYVPVDLAKKKVERYKYWSIKDEAGITFNSSDDTQDGRSFADILDKIVADNVDGEVQVKIGTNEQSSRQKPPIFIRIKEKTEWVEPEEEETIKINGVPHRLDKNGNVNINLQTPNIETPTVEYPSDIIRQEMEIQLAGLRKESELKDQRFQIEIQNKLGEQTLKFKEMMLAEREARLNEREQILNQQEVSLNEKKQEITEDLKGYVKHVPNVLGKLVKDWLKTTNGTTDKTSLGNTTKPKKKRTKVNFELEEDTTTKDTRNIDNDDFDDFDDVDDELDQEETQSTEDN